MPRLGLSLVRVRGRSMEPTLHTGDRLVVLRGAPPKLGRLAIVRLPPDDAGMPRPLAIKRVTMLDPEDPTRYWVEADNQGELGVADSWTYGIGSLARDQIRALVLFRLPHRLRWPGRRRRQPPHKAR
ncbi:S24/S26 family peptidase [Knoellia koreensis]|uniref:S24/S26 family peptidase n=1 Tax=Knoellia koreensis TaxID=2730921 RepID=A0A849H7G6_9MICO|nr:S24/S26 family peptidase [Knoellia sp. DB2414S]